MPLLLQKGFWKLKEVEELSFLVGLGKIFKGSSSFTVSIPLFVQ